MDSLSQQSQHELNVVWGVYTSCQRDGLTLTTITASIKRCLRHIHLLSERWTHSHNNHSINYTLSEACTPPVREMDSLSQQSQHQLHVVWGVYTSCQMDSLSQQSQHQLHVVWGVHSSCQRDGLTLTTITASITRCLRRVHLLSERWTHSHNNHSINYTLSEACTPPVREMNSLSQQSQHQLNVVCGVHTSCQRDELTLTTITASIKRCLWRAHLLSERWTHSHNNHSIN